MIISENRQPTLPLFKELMQKTDILLNNDAAKRQDYYAKRGGKLVEIDVFNAICEAAKKTVFDKTIQLVSGSTFPDIIAGKYYGVEVKSTEKNHWTSIGSSILESTRNADVERIFLTFGKLGKPVEFKTRAYEECLSGIAVTHYPRYQIDMQLKQGETIFDKMEISYNELRTMDNPIVPVSKYYKSKLKQGESLWWAADDTEAISPATVRLWTTLTHEAKEELTIQGYALFPELLKSGSNKKYNRYALWLATNQGVINTNVRDSFSAGGKVDINTKKAGIVKMPAAFGRIKKHHELIQKTIEEAKPEVLMDYWNVNKIAKNRIRQWCELVAAEANKNIEYTIVWSILSNIFTFIDNEQPKNMIPIYNPEHKISIVAEPINLYGTTYAEKEKKKKSSVDIKKLRK